MYGQLGFGDSDDYGDDLDGVMDVLQKEVAFGVPVWAAVLGGVALLGFTKPGKKLLGGLTGGKAKKRNPRRRSRKHNRRRSRR